MIAVRRLISFKYARKSGRCPLKVLVTHGTGLVHFKAVDSITRSFLSTSDGSNSQHDVQKTTATLEDQINQIQSEISATKGRRNELLSSDRDLAIALTEEIVETEKRLRILTKQRGNLPRIYPFFFSNPLNNVLFAQYLSTSPLHPSSFGNDAR